MENTEKGLYKIDLREPLDWEGKTYKTLSFDFLKITGRDCEDIEVELAQQGVSVLIAKFSGPFLIRMASKANVEKLGCDALLKLCAKDFMAVKDKAKSFL